MQNLFNGFVAIFVDRAILFLLIELFFVDRAIFDNRQESMKVVTFPQFGMRKRVASS